LPEVPNPLSGEGENIECGFDEDGHFVCTREDGTRVDFARDENDELIAVGWDGDQETVREIRDEVEGRKVVKVRRG